MPGLVGYSANDQRIAGISNEDGVAFVGAMGTTTFYTGDELVLHLVKDAGTASETKYRCAKILTDTDILYTDRYSYGAKTKVYAAKVPFSAFTLE